MKKVIVFEHGIESLAYFSGRIGEILEKEGLQVFYYKLDQDERTIQAQRKKLRKFHKPGETMLISFNFNGFRGEEEFYEDDVLIWKRLEIPCINIMVDHPFYYPGLLDKVEEELGFDLYYQVLIDRDHEKFIRRFYPGISHVMFFPLAGSCAEYIPTERKYDVVFTGNYTPPQKFRKYIERIDDEYTAFYEGIIADLIENPDTTMEQAFEKHLKREMGEISDSDLRTCMGNMIFIDLYVRFYFRGEIIRTIAEAGIPVHIWGAGFDQLQCSKPENLILEGPTDTDGCLNALANAKISLNVMPWFKDGAHDRVYSAMCNEALCLTDHSRFMRQDLSDGKNVVFYSLKEYKNLPDLIRQLLSQQEKRKEIAKAGREHAMEKHVWSERVPQLLEFVKENGPK